MLLTRTKGFKTEAEIDLDVLDTSNAPKTSEEAPNKFTKLVDCFNSQENCDNEGTWVNQEQWLTLAENIIAKYKENEAKKMEALQEHYYFYAAEYFSADLIQFSLEEKCKIVEIWEKLSKITGPCGEIFEYINSVVKKICEENKLQSCGSEYKEQFSKDILEEIFCN